jgi:hypothetical protein
MWRRRYFFPVALESCFVSVALEPLGLALGLLLLELLLGLLPLELLVLGVDIPGEALPGAELIPLVLASTPSLLIVS